MFAAGLVRSLAGPHGRHAHSVQQKLGLRTSSDCAAMNWAHESAQCNVQARLCKSASIPPRTNTCLLTVSQKSYARVIEPPIVQEIISPANNYIKHCCKLASSRAYREQAGSVLIVGHIPVQEIAEHTAVRVLFLAQGAPAPAGCSPHYPASSHLHNLTQ